MHLVILNVPPFTQHTTPPPLRSCNQPSPRSSSSFSPRRISIVTACRWEAVRWVKIRISGPRHHGIFYPPCSLASSMLRHGAVGRTLNVVSDLSSGTVTSPTRQNSRQDQNPSIVVLLIIFRNNRVLPAICGVYPSPPVSRPQNKDKDVICGLDSDESLDHEYPTSIS